MQNDINKWNNLKLNPTTLPEIYNELLFFNTRSIKQNSKSQYAMKNPPPWARDHFGTVGDICKKRCIWLYINRRTPKRKQKKGDEI